MWVWGYNGSGQLATGNNISYSSPVQTIAGGNNWKQVALNPRCSSMVAVKTDGTLWTAGRGNYGLLGNGTSLCVSSPVQVYNNTNWKSVAAGGYTIMGLTFC
jgi:alpha-tubulin suppressor-like RCC1 family protein